MESWRALLTARRGADRGPSLARLVGAALIVLALVAAYAVANLRPLWLVAAFGAAAMLVLVTRLELAVLALPLVIFLPDIGRDIPGPFALFVHDLFVLALFGLYAARQIVLRRPIVCLDRRAARWLAAFVLIAAVSLIKGAMLPREPFVIGLKDWIRLVELCLLLVALTGLLQTRRQVELLLWGLLLAGGAALAVAFWAHFSDSEAFYRLMDMRRATVQVGDLRVRMISTMGTAAHTGVTFATLAALATALLRRGSGRLASAWALALIAACLVCVALTYSKATWLAVVLALLVLWAAGRLPRAWMFAFAALLVTAALTLTALWSPDVDPGVLASDFFRLSRSSAEVRLQRWASVQNVLLSEPLLGVGYNCYAYIYGQYALTPQLSSDYGHPHNMYIDVLTGTGLVGLIAFLGFWSRVLGVARRLTLSGSGAPATLARAGYLALLVFLGVSLFNSFLFKAGRAAMLLFVVAAIVLALQRQAAQSQAAESEVQDRGH